VLAYSDYYRVVNHQWIKSGHYFWYGLIYRKYSDTWRILCSLICQKDKHIISTLDHTYTSVEVELFTSFSSAIPPILSWNSTVANQPEKKSIKRAQNNRTQADKNVLRTLHICSLAMQLKLSRLATGLHRMNPDLCNCYDAKRFKSFMIFLLAFSQIPTIRSEE
jgi:hypothetical protein